ncbi:MAG: hypothetical protein ACK4RK_03060 [Gemmataceae bacterium]
MTKLIVDENLPMRLPQLLQPVELCDTEGRVLGRYFPHLDPSQFNLEPRINADELLRRKMSHEKTYSTAEVLKHLENL